MICNYNLLPGYGSAAFYVNTAVTALCSSLPQAAAANAADGQGPADTSDSVVTATLDASAELSSDKPADVSSDKPAELSSGNPAELSSDKPADVSSGKPADVSSDKPAKLSSDIKQATRDAGGQIPSDTSDVSASTSGGRKMLQDVSASYRG